MKLAFEVLRAEGAAAVRDRLRDRLAAWRRRRRYRLVEEVSAVELDSAGSREEASIPVLNVLPTAPRPDLGGVQVQLLRRLEAETRPWALLYPEAGGYRLETRDGSRRRAVAYRVPVAKGIERLEDETFLRVLRHAAGRLGARAVHVEQAVGLPLASLAELRRSGDLRLILSVHDFGFFCLRPHLVEQPQQRFCGYCRQAERCARCLAVDWRLEDGYQERRRALAARLLGAADAVVYASEFLRRTAAELVPGLDRGRQWVVEPPSVGAGVRVAGVRPRPRVRHLAYVGSVQPHKGALVLEQLICALGGDRYPDLRWSVYGGGDRDILHRLRRLPAVRVRGYYRAGAVPRMLRDDGVDLALLLSIWPEAYALTLDESLLAGVPVLAFDHGALAERLERQRAGALVPVAGGARAVLDGLRPILEEGWRPPEPGPDFEPPAAGQAAGACLEIYRRLGVDAVAGGTGRQPRD